MAVVSTGYSPTFVFYNNTSHSIMRLLKFCLFFVALTGASVVNGQASVSKGNAAIDGIILDTLSKKPVDYATVALLVKSSNQVIDGSVTDEKGVFEIKNIKAGDYILEYTFLGYQTKRSNVITLVDGAKIKIGRVYLAPSSLTLKEVTVYSQQDIVEEKVDRLVYNAERDISSKGGDASDVLRKVPLLTVDLEGEVSLRGSSNVKVLINNKPSSIMAGSVADALKQIPADMIKSVEVITSPSARYESEGSVGIINIVTKKNTLQGLTLGTDISAGNRGAMLGLNGNYRQGNMGFSLRGHGRAEYNVKGEFENTQSTQSTLGLQSSTQSAQTLRQQLHGNYNLGWDWDISKKATLTSGLRFGTRSGLNEQNNLITRTFLPGATIPLLSGRNVDSKDINLSYDFNTSYTYIFKPLQEFSLLGLISRNNRTNNFEADLLNNVDFATITARQKNDNISFNQENTIQAEYQAPIGELQLIEVGGKGIFRVVNSDYQYYYSEGSNSPYALDASRASNELNYNQTVGAGFLSYTLTTKNKWSLKAGTRLEYTEIDAQFQNNLYGEKTAIPSYWSLIPSVNLSKSLSKIVTLKTGYNRRIQRPGIQFLNPNVNESNPTNISVGNPYLDPEFTDNFELSSSINLKGVFLTGAVFYRHTGNSITSLRDTFTINNPNPLELGTISAIRTTYQNIGNENTVGFNIFGNVSLFKIWQINGGIDAYHIKLTNNNPNPLYAASNSGMVFGGRLFSNVRLKNGWGLQGGGGARGRQVNLQGTSGSFAFYSIGLRKDLPNNKGNISLSTENFLNHPFRVNSNSKSPILEQSSTNSFYNAGVRLGISYRIGKMTFEDRRNKRSINNDDVKGSEGGGGGQGGDGASEQPAQGNGRGQGQRPANAQTRPGGQPQMGKDSTSSNPQQMRVFPGQDSTAKSQWQGRRPGGAQDSTNRSQWQGRKPGPDSLPFNPAGAQGRPRNQNDTPTSPATGDPKNEFKLPEDKSIKPTLLLVEMDKVPVVRDTIPVKKQE